MQPEQRSSYLAAQAREHDPDRYLAALFAPGERRDTVLALVLLHHELARVPDLVSQPMVGLIRYQWWRDALDEIAAARPPRQHPVALVLAEAHARGWLDLAALQRLIDAHERRLEDDTPGDLAALEHHARATSGLAQGEIYRALGGDDGPAMEAARTIGTGIGMVGLGRAGPQVPDPGIVLDRAAALIEAGRAAAGRPPRSTLAAFLPGRLAAAEVARGRRRGGDPFVAGPSRRPPTAVPTLLAAWLTRRP